ncbi:MAG: MarR family transcriptional regulator [Candidatus Dadabacteria bacterium]|nr:MarR family transcriptional regulator [Candidatus Dadabacteria bacterium]MCH8079639.1 MarR family transcriptional regulator [Pseudomonadota bacterium]
MKSQEMSNKRRKYKQLSECSCNMMRKSARKITQFYENNLREAGIKPTQFSILATLANTGPIQLTQLANRLVLERTSLTRNLNVLERNTWIDIQPGEEDSRQRVVSLTRNGYKQLDCAIPYWQKAQKAIAKDMGQETITGLRTTLDEMTEIITV